MNKKLLEIRKEEFQIAKINVRLLQNAKRFCKIQNANDLVFKKDYYKDIVIRRHFLKVEMEQ